MQESKGGRQPRPCSGGVRATTNNGSAWRSLNEDSTPRYRALILLCALSLPVLSGCFEREPLIRTVEVERVIRDPVEVEPALTAPITEPAIPEGELLCPDLARLGLQYREAFYACEGQKKAIREGHQADDR